MITIDLALEVFMRGFSFTRSFTHPYIPQKIERGVWMVGDAPRKSGIYRKDEYAAYGLSPEVLHEIAQKHSRNRYQICAFLKDGESDADLRSEFKALGYRLGATEAFMVNDLRAVPAASAPVGIKRVETQDEADRLAKAARTRQILPEHLSTKNPPLREYMAVDGEEIVGWVGSVMVGKYQWCTNMHVVPSHRRRGIARALMARMLEDDRATGANANVLTASHAGSKLYPLVGYQQLGRLYIFTPPRT